MSKVFLFRSFIGLAMALSVSSTPAFAQAGGSGAGAGSTGGGAAGGSTGGGSTGGGTTTPGRGNPDPNSNSRIPQNSPSSQMPEMPRPIYLSGKVQMDDGTPPPSQVVIERVCNGVARPEGYTSSKGHFSFALGQNTAMLADASVGRMGESPMGSGRMSGGSGSQVGPMGAPSGMSLLGCELRAALPGFRSDTVDLSQRRSLDNGEVGTIVLHRMGKVEGFTFSGTSSFAPKDAKKAYEKGHEAIKKNKLEDAQVNLQKAVDIYPKYAVAWYELGMVNQQNKKLDEAKRCYDEALKADSKFVSPYAQLAKMAAVTQNWQSAAEYSGKVLKLNPYDFADIYFYSAVANLNLNNLEVAEESAREGLKLDTQNKNPRMNQVLGVVLARKQDFTGAAASMKSYLKLAPNAPDVDQVKHQIEEIERQVTPPDAASAKNP